MEKQFNSQPVDSNYIEKLKVARSTVIQDSDTKSEKSNPVHQTTNEVTQELTRKSEKKFDAEFDVLYHQQIIQGILSDLGYTPRPMNEGLAVIFSELAKENFTGLGLSFGGGMVNVCLANLSVPLISFSIARGGDWIDKQVARVVNEPISIITSFKESSLDLEKKEIYQGLSRLW